MGKDRQLASSGHRLGQVVGDWWERHFALPLLKGVADKLDLFLDCRFVERSCRGEKILWPDLDGNNVDYDFVLELGGIAGKRGIPVGFIETFWRRGARHSKDKARDDSGKLLPMRATYPTARYLGIVACGDFTVPARDYVSSRSIDLFYVPKQKILDAFSAVGITIDYADNLSEERKSAIAGEVDQRLPGKEALIAVELAKLVGVVALDAFTHQFIAALAAAPQEIRFQESTHSRRVVFEEIARASDFLASPTFEPAPGDVTYRYGITYSNGDEFDRDVPTLDALRELHAEIVKLAGHMESVLRPN